MLNYHSIIIQVCLYFTLLFAGVLCDEVPVILWNIKGNALNIKPVSALGQDDNAFDETLKDIRAQKANVLVFATSKASLEDFSSEESSSNSTIKNLQTFLDNAQRYMFMSSVQDPLQRIQSFHCGVKAIVVDGIIDENVIQSVAQTFDESCVVILHIGDSNVVGLKDPTPEDLRRVFQPAFEKNSNDVVGIFTATETSWGKSREESHRFRNLLAAEEADPNFINIDGCLIMYAEKATLKGKVGNVTVNLPFPPVTTDSKCDNSSESVLQLTFTPTTTTDFSSVIVKFNFTVKGGSWTTEASIETKGDKTNYAETMRAGDLQAPLGFSWSCGNFVLGNRNSSNAVTVTFEGFQVQPFRVKEKFSDSFDCVTWFTVPIWMGIFVTILFVAIINCGVYALFSVHTMDRFDDPKGKTITVAAATD